MALDKMYDVVSSNYTKLSKKFTIVSQSSETAFEQLQSFINPGSEKYHVMDLGVGNGEYLKRIQNCYPDFQLYGIDISEKMLAQAGTQVKMQSAVTDIGSVNNFFPPQLFDLVTAHFVCGYVGLEAVLKQANYLLNAGGIISIVTSTKELGREIYQRYCFSFRNSLNPLKKLLLFLAKRAMQDTKSVPENWDDIYQLTQKYHFGIVDRKQLRFDFTAETPQELIDFAIHSGWFVSIFDYKFLPTQIIIPLCKLLATALKFPIKEQVIVEVALLSRNR